MSLKSQMPYPGQISIGAPQAYPGCKAKWFWSVGGFNDFFSEKPNETPHGYLVVHHEVVPYLFGLFVGVSCMYTKQLDPQEEDDMVEVTRRIESEMFEIRKKRREAREKEELAKRLADEEIKRLAKVGAAYEERVSHMRKMDPGDDERKAIEKALNKGDPEVLFQSKKEAFEAGFMTGSTNK